MSERVVPSVVVGKKENGAIRATNNECMHVGEFGSVRNLNGFETNVERIVALRTHPLQTEFRMRNQADGFRVQWDLLGFQGAMAPLPNDLAAVCPSPGGRLHLHLQGGQPA